jgi:FAD/FMN-containing dehydrogenase
MAPSDPIDESAVRAFRNRLRGNLLRPGEPGYDDARTVWNAMIDREPAAIARCAGTADVIAGVEFAREQNLRLSVKGGGHHVSGAAVCEDGLVLDLGAMDGIRVDPAAKTVRVGGGATWGQVDHETQAFGLATPGGQDPDIGVGGLTLGGGVGWLSPKYGLACDNLLSADVVTADGELVHASESEHPDLFWALRGGGGNFGVVTNFEFQLHAVGPEIFAGSLVYPFEETVDVGRFYREFAAEAPREVRLLFGSMVLPDSDYYPTTVRDTRVAMLIAFSAGPPADGEAVLAPLRDRGDPVMDSLQSRSYTDYQRAGHAGGAMRTDLRSQYVAAPTDAVLETIADYAAAAPSAGATVFVSPWLGAETDPAPDATAYPHREPAHHILVEARWTDPARDDEHISWVRECHRALCPHATGAAEANFLADVDDEARLRAAYGENYARLVDVKTDWDPTNLFRQNPNVAPRESADREGPT